MKDYARNNKNTPITKWDWLLAVLVVAVLVATLALTLTPRDRAEVATVYVDGAAVSTLYLGADYNKVATYSGVLVRADGGAVETVHNGRVARLSRKGDKIVFPTLGVVVECS